MKENLQKLVFTLIIILFVGTVFLTVTNALSNSEDPTFYSNSTALINSTLIENNTVQNVEGTGVQITALHPYDGSTEYVNLTNYGNYTVDLKNWKLITSRGREFILSDFTVKPGETLTVFTAEGTNTEDSYYLNSTRYIWNENDTARLIYESDYTVSADNSSVPDINVNNTQAVDDNSNNTQAVDDNSNVSINDNGKTLNLKNGDTFFLELRENPSTGYSWQLNLSQGLSILTDKYTQDPAAEGQVGAPGTHLWEIKAVTQGSQQIKGIYKQPWMNTTGTDKNFTLYVEIT